MADLVPWKCWFGQGGCCHHKEKGTGHGLSSPVFLEISGHYLYHRV